MYQERKFLIYLLKRKAKKRIVRIITEFDKYFLLIKYQKDQHDRNYDLTQM